MQIHIGRDLGVDLAVELLPLLILDDVVARDVGELARILGSGKWRCGVDVRRKVAAEVRAVRVDELLHRRGRATKKEPSREAGASGDRRAGAERPAAGRAGDTRHTG